jgi:3-deoxy-D-manno-octulosonic-acid transferase
MAGWILNLIYALALLVASPLLAYRSLVHSKYRTGWREKLLGLAPRRLSTNPCAWFHAVSVGEVLLLQPVLAALRRTRPEIDIWISTTTATGHAVARDKFPGDHVFYFPLDFTWSVRRAIQHVQPDLICLAELELWPNFIKAAHSAGVPLLLLNGRISERSFRGYRRIGWLVEQWLRRFSVLTVQTDEYAERIEALGAPPDRVIVTGSVKYDGLQSDRLNTRTQQLRTAFALRDDDVVFIAGSTQAPEEALALDAYQKLKVEFPKLRLILVPRHKERFEEVAAIVRSRGLPLLRRNETASPNGDASQVLLLDTLGELAACWGLADVAFVGGSISRRGGQNMLEPAAYGAAVLFGPNTFHFRHAVEMLLLRDAAKVVHSGDELAATVLLLLANENLRRAMGRRARDLVLSQRGATDRVMHSILNLLDERTPSPTCRAA